MLAHRVAQGRVTDRWNEMDRHPTRKEREAGLGLRNGGGEPMFYYWGMGAYWWIFWIALWILFFIFLVPIRRSRWVSHHHLESPMQVLQRRYAAGEITTEEYEERKAKLLADANLK
jgi:putative membrane protein